MLTEINRRLRRFRWLPFCLPVLSCSDIFGPGIPAGAIPLSPVPRSFAHWWTIAEACSGLRGNYGELTWWSVPGQRTIPGSHGAAGRYIRRERSIVLGENQERDGFLVRHEMLHALLDGSGGSAHPRLIYENRCGGIVSCAGTCAAEIGGPPPEVLSASPLVLSPADVSAQVVPAVVSESTLATECFTIVVRATNTGTEAAVMNLDEVPPMTWIVDDVGGGSGGGPIPPNAIVLLRPGDSRSYAFDCPAQLVSLSAGNYLVRAQIGTVRSGAVSLVVLPQQD